MHVYYLTAPQYCTEPFENIFQNYCGILLIFGWWACFNIKMMRFFVETCSIFTQRYSTWTLQLGVLDLKFSTAVQCTLYSQLYSRTGSFCQMFWIYIQLYPGRYFVYYYTKYYSCTTAVCNVLQLYSTAVVSGYRYLSTRVLSIIQSYRQIYGCTNCST